MNLAERLRLLLILDIPLLGDRDPVSAAVAAEQGGVTGVQLRWKGASARDQVALARRLREALGVPLFVNDRLDVALAAEAAGVHLGGDDLPVTLARRVVPAGFVIGASVGDPAEAAASAGAGYVGIGPWRATTTKQDAGPALGAAGVRRLLGLVPVPAVVIGGVRPEDIPEVLATGAVGVAVASAILGAADVTKAARAFRDRLPR
ncbi:MAG TPA: thiamine phosphate synthase [Gemmatimonadales bacterium]|jgi:thiamine-phosphate pyrophosphorylase|nr:thiamine phosphate synthase [Gemmatimonadales bacterium]